MSLADDLVAATTDQTTVVDSVVVFLTTLHQKLLDALAAGNPTAMRAAIDTINANKQKIADAIIANTDAEPTP